MRPVVILEEDDETQAQFEDQPNEQGQVILRSLKQMMGGARPGNSFENRLLAHVTEVGLTNFREQQDTVLAEMLSWQENRPSFNKAIATVIKRWSNFVLVSTLTEGVSDEEKERLPFYVDIFESKACDFIRMCVSALQYC